MDLHFRKSGEHGPTLMILHGLFGSSDNWQTLGRELANDFQVYLVDQRDHGRSPHSDAIDYQKMANDIQELIQREGLAEVNLIGHSMGGKTAMTFAQRFPELLNKLVVVDIGPRVYEDRHSFILEGVLSADLEQLASRKAVEEHLGAYIPEPGVRQFIMKNLYWVEDRKLGWRANFKLLKRDLSNIVASISPDRVEVPTLFIRGGASDYILKEDIPAIKEQFPRSQFETVPFAGHWVHVQAPEDFLRMVRDFLEP